MKLIRFGLPILLWPCIGLAAADYAWQWPLQLDGAEPIQRLQLDESVYASLQDPLLRDLDIIDAEGQRAAVALDGERARFVVNTTRSAVAWFPLRRTEIDNAAGLRAVIEGARVVVESAPGTAVTTERLDALLVDLGDDWRSVRRLALQPADPALGWSLRTRVETSSDLASWRSLRPPVQLYSLRHDSHVLQQWLVDWTGEADRYVRLRPDQPQADAALAAITRIDAERRETVSEGEPELASLLLEPEAGEAPGEWRYRLPGPLPVRQWSLQFERSPWVAGVELDSRGDSDRPWARRASAVAYRIDVDGDTLASAPEPLSPNRDREWRLRLLDDVAAPPRLRVDYLPDLLLFSVVAGKQYRLVAGSGLQRRIDAPVPTLLAALRSRRGADWRPPLANLGPRAELAGEAALRQIDTGDRLGRLALWAVLVVAAMSLAVIALRLLRAQAADSAKAP